ncbi:hypothetical protein [Microlunatus soli]|uniref:LPXTG-motif cell wall anchor domain-containing protein n=1 Tax=Microlunatus soli TaxID=630515 RepID=A0A1H1VJ33_9ACTN|nr:hypothetical protein [Microlunatus soli]SDS84540.1 hypothetical protein SAMN04489812_3228 [Microlunatus soli]
MSGHKPGWWLSLGAMIIVAVSALTPASAVSQDEVQVSSDARHWQSDLDRPLFDPDARWVPGDVETTTLWIRNAATTAGTLRVAVDPLDHDQFLRHGLHLRARASGSDWVTLAPDGSARRITGRLPAGATTQLWITASFDAAAGNVSQERRADLRLRVTLSQLIDDGHPPPAGPTTGPPTQPPTAAPPTGDHSGAPTASAAPGPGDLAGTGLDARAAVVLIGAAAVGAGVALLQRPRRRSREHHDD